MLHLLETTQNHVRLSNDFLAPYRKAVDPFKSLLARSTYLTKYSRWGETWTDTILRSVLGNVSQDPRVTEDEAKQLFHLFWTAQMLPPGRGLWTGGVDGISADARYNCWGVELRSIDDWCWTANQLMLGGGVGVSLLKLDTFPPVAAGEAKFGIYCSEGHANLDEVKPEGPQYLNGTTPLYRCEDSRQGWVKALRLTLEAAWEGRSLIVDVSDVRPRGALIKTFGGVACGPGPLVNLLRAAWALVRGARGRKLNSLEALDITNHIGLCIKSGNVRRSAIIVLGSPTDQAFRDAKKDSSAILSHRHTSNNTIVFEDEATIRDFDWDSLIDDNIQFGEPGIYNLFKARQTDPDVVAINPCFRGDTLVAVADGRNAVSIQQLAEEGKDVPVYSVNKETGLVEIKMGRNPRVTGYGRTLVRVHLDDGGYLDVTPDHKCLLLDGTPILASDLKPGMSLPRFTKALEPVKKGGKDYYLMHCNTRDYKDARVFEHRLIAKFNDPEKWDETYKSCSQNGFTLTGGLVVHHKDYNPLNNSPDNLQIMSFREHTELHAAHDTQGEQNGRWSGFSHEEIKSHALQLTKSLGRRFSKDEWYALAEKEGLPKTFSAYRRDNLGTLLTLSQQCALELGFEHVSEDPRVVQTYNSMLEQGYNARVQDGQVDVEKTCEMCGETFWVQHSHRERSFCSTVCGNKHINSNKDVHSKRLAGSSKMYASKQVDTKLEQARVYSGLKFKLNRDPNRKEWSLACKAEGIPSRIGPTLTHGFKYFHEVLEAAANYNHKVSRVEYLDGEHTVYNITVDDFHTVGIVTSSKEKGGSLSYTGVYVLNCGEVPLHHREACNLAELFPAQFQTGTDAAHALKLLTRYSLRQRLAPLEDPTAEAVRVKNMRVGVALGGVCDFDWSPETLRGWKRVVDTAAYEYADFLGVARPNATTTLKPSGTISLLNGSAPGAHAQHSPFYIRNVRIAKNDKLAAVLMEAGVPFEADVYDKSENTWVFSFPTAAPNPKLTKKNETLRQQFERQRDLQAYWADNAVSMTINFDPETERKEAADLMREFVPQLKSTSLLPSSHGYEQAPYIEIDESTYRSMYSQIQHDHKLAKVGDLDSLQLDECSGGACPVR